MIQPLGRVPLPSRGWATPTAVPMDAQRVGPFKKNIVPTWDTIKTNQHEVSQEFYGQGVGGTRAAANEQLLQILKSLPLNPQSHGTVLANSFQITILQTKFVNSRKIWRNVAKRWCNILFTSMEYQVPFIANKLNHRLKKCKIPPSGRLALVLGLILLQKLGFSIIPVAASLH